MKKTLPLRLPGLITVTVMIMVASAASADLNLTRIPEHDPGLSPPPGQSTLTGSCTISYYNFCSGWIWIWSGFSVGDEVGVMFDLPADCGKEPGEMCENTGVWWYWRYTMPGRAFGVYYEMYEVDASWCLSGPPVGPAVYADPVERWNYTTGLGSVASDRAAIISRWSKGTQPSMATDNNVANENAAGCQGLTSPDNSFRYTYNGEPSDCPSGRFHDDIGRTDIIMRAAFTCGTTATDPASWGGIKALFE